MSNLEIEESAHQFYSFNTGDANHDANMRELVFDGPVAEWVEERRLKYGEHLAPAHMYVRNWQEIDEHRVAWIYHAGLVVDTTDEQLQGYRSYHAICDCAVHAEPSAVPPEILSCPELEASLADRAEHWSRQYKIPEIFGTLTMYDEEQGEFALTPQGLDLAMSSIVGFLKRERQEPDQWFGNFISGRLPAETVATLLHQAEGEIVPLLQKMHQAQVVEYDGEVVRLPLAA